MHNIVLLSCWNSPQIDPVNKKSLSICFDTPYIIASAKSISSTLDTMRFAGIGVLFRSRSVSKLHRELELRLNRSCSSGWNNSRSRDGGMHPEDVILRQGPNRLLWMDTCWSWRGNFWIVDRRYCDDEMLLFSVVDFLTKVSTSTLSSNRTRFCARTLGDWRDNIVFFADEFLVDWLFMFGLRMLYLDL